MATNKSVMRYKSAVPPAESRPLPQHREKLNDRQYRRLLRNDAQLAVAILNAAHGDAHEKLVTIRQGLQELRTTASELQRVSERLDEEMLHPSGPLECRGDARASKECFAISDEYNGIMRRLQGQHIAMNEQLARYAFRLCVSYTVSADEWRYGLVPDQNRRCFETKIGPYKVSEADAAMALVRLDASGELSEVKLCEHCHRVWLYARRPTFDRHCSKECREAAYKEDPQYLARKAKNQRNYRDSQKRENARAVANLAKLKGKE